MKKIYLLTLLLLIPYLYLNAQSSSSRGYVGISIGPSFALGDYASTDGDNGGAAETGLQINLINLGYKFTDNLGIAITWLGGANNVDLSSFGLESDDPWTYGAIAIGPLISVPVSNNVDLDLKPAIGFGTLRSPSITGVLASEDGTDTVFNFGSTLKFKFSSKAAFLLNADYLSMEPELGDLGISQKVTTLSLSVGIGLTF